jgi:hypothetical protein
MNVFFPDVSSLAYNKDLGGTTGTKLYKNSAGKKWVIKKAEKGGGPAQVLAEFSANKIYEVCGIPVPKCKLVNQETTLILDYIDGKLLSQATPEEMSKAKEELKKGFIIDALLANWDVIGLGKDNIILPSDGGPPVRIDNGASFMFRAKGKPKPYTPKVIELNTMRDKMLSPQAGPIFGDLTDTDIDTQIKTIIIPNYEAILSVVEKLGLLKSVLKARMDYCIERTVWMNASAFKNSVVETETPEYIDPVQKALLKFFKHGWETQDYSETTLTLLDYINLALKINGAAISGGFILKAIGAFVDEKSVDMDVYVPTANAENFRNIMMKLFKAESVVKHVVSEGSTFFKKNGILSVTKYAKNTPSYAEMDIVEVNSDRLPTDVIKNFDLTFCENWYDGETVYMAYPEHVKTKHGFLENHYLNLYYQGNMVLKKRMKKYIDRGFTISIHNPATKTNENITQKITQEFLTTTTTKPPESTAMPTSTFTTSRTFEPLPMVNNSAMINLIQTELNTSNTNGSKPAIGNLITTLKTATINATQYIPTPDAKSLSPIELLCLKLYTGPGSGLINQYLYLKTIPTLTYNIMKNKIFTYLAKKFPKLDTETQEEYQKKVIYYIFINLYNTIQRTPKISPSVPFLVYRGVLEDYLQTDPSLFYYMNSFVSTSMDSRFGQEQRGKLQYIFYAHPLCNYMNVTGISIYKFEKEILFTPYHRCLFLDGNATKKRFILFPTDLDIPKTFEEFEIWKKSVSSMTTPVYGGRAVPFNNARNNTLLNMPFTINRTAMNKTMKKLNTKILWKNSIKMEKAKNNSTTKKTSNNRAEKDRMRRFTDPIPSFPGKAPTPEELAVIEQMKQMLGPLTSK